MKLLRLMFLLVVAFVVSSYLQAQTVDPKAILDSDPNLKIGKLDNGLVYYIRNNHKPEKRVFLWLALKAGSTAENDDQQGLAHFTEHMAFNGTKNFKKNDLIDFLEKMGVKFGAELNAHTAFNETVYKLQVPTDKPELVDKGFLVLEDWAQGLALEDKEIDKERGVITEEWRLGLGAQDRMMKKYFPVLLKGSRYAERMPIGKIDVIKNFKHETLRNFYRDWYRPDLMAVIVVGDIDVNVAEQKVKEHFAKMKNPENERKSVDFDIPDNKEPLIAITSDKEATNANIQIFYKHIKKEQKLIGDYRRYMLYNLFTSMLNNRFEELTNKPEAPFLYAYSNYGDFLARSKDAYVLGAGAKENQIEKSLEVLLAENEKVRRFGFTETELERAKADMLSMYETYAKEVDKTESSSFVREFVGNFLNGEPIPGIKNELKYAQAFVPGMKLDEINQLSKGTITDDNLCVVVTSPEKEGLKIPTEADILKVIKASKTNFVAAYVDKVSSSPLVESIPAGTKVVSSKENKDFGYTELTFANNVKVILKPTDFKNDEILFSAYSPGGTSLYPDKDIMSAMFASTIIDQSGISKFDDTELKKKLSGKVVQVSPYIDDLREGFSGSAAPKDFETLLQLTYLYFKEPRKDTTTFKAFISKVKNQIKFISSSPQIVYRDTLNKIITKNNPRTISIPTMKQIDEINLDLIYSMYKDRFSDASDFTFFIIGNFKINEITPMLETYLGGLPSVNRKETWKNVEPKFPEGITDVTIYKGVEQKSNVTIMMMDKFEWNYKNLINYQIMMDALSIRLRNIMREDKSGVYGLQASGSNELYPEPKYTITFAWGCSPKNVKMLSKTVFKQIAKFQKDGPTKEELEKVKETMNRDREVNIKKNNFWLSKLENLYYMDIKLNTLEEYQKIVNSVTIEDIKKESQKYLTGNHYVRVVLMPEAKK